jgi:formylglycine-generating enzyme required for sulfatase activity/serine/threonine protein kinase
MSRMAWICPWCQQPLEVPSATALPEACPGCGHCLIALRPTLPLPETITDPYPGTAAEDRPPPQLGRYRISALLGSGGFGAVYKGHDEELQRDVAIKVPHPQRVARDEDADVYLTEARALAALDHPGIVPVYDVGRTDAGLCYLVSKFIEGEDLSGRLRRAGRPTPVETARLIARVAEALHHAHQRGLVHRDVKPGNILLDKEGQPYVADFGLALREEDFARGSSFAGTPAYMSPEQARSEGHRVDHRTDIWSLGVVFYELLTGQLPFQGQTIAELLEQITTREPQPPHQLAADVPPELERICLRALGKRASDRHPSLADMMEDLHHWLSERMKDEGERMNQEAQTPTGSAVDPSSFILHPSKVIPKGLRPFDAVDADFFLELLPGPRDREGMPASLRFWKTRIDSTDPTVTFAVGLIYGPSGCGKSSLVRAGLLPRLLPRVTTLYVEAAPEGTERRILGGLWHSCPDLAGEMDLAAVVGDLRRGKALSPGRKLLVVLDQFEQFLHGQGERLANSPLVAALRQADGVRVQFLLLVRDDFWLAASRLFQELEIPLVEGQNLELVDLFEPRHARHVLDLFGRAYNRLPENPADTTAEQRAFLDEATAGLSQDGKVISVRLSLFAEMMKGRPWTPQSLREVGGTEGVGLTFLQETFSGPTARPDRRAAEATARAVLAALLPEDGGNIRGRVRSRDDLLVASGLQGHAHRFERLLDLLDRDLRIITPTEADTQARSTSEGAPARRASEGCYQLTHDYLVRPLREWLTRKQKETWRGRAELRLAERTAQWTRSPQDRFLPSPQEYVTILLTVPRRRRQPEERKLLGAAARHYGSIAAVFLVALAVLGWATWDLNGREQQARVVETIEHARLDDLPRIIQDELPRYRRWADPALHALADHDGTDPDQRLRASLALLDVDDHQADYLRGRLLDCAPAEFPVVRAALERHADRCNPALWAALHDPGRRAAKRFQAGLALAGYASDAADWSDADADFLTAQLLQARPEAQPALRDYLSPISRRLLGPLQRVFHDSRAPVELRLAAAEALAAYAGDQPGLLARLVSEAAPAESGGLRDALERPAVRAEAVKALQDLVSKPTPTGASEQQRVEAGRRRAGAALTLLYLGQRSAVFPVFQYDDDPEALTQFVHQLRGRRLPPEAVLDCLDEATAADVPARFALVLALGEFRFEELPEARRQTLREHLAEWYREDPKSAIHGACGWLLRRWGCRDEVERVDQTPLSPNRAGNPEWFVERVEGECVTFVVFAPGSFVMGSPPDEEYRQKNEPQHRVQLTHAFAVADREVTQAQYERFLKDDDRKAAGDDEDTADHRLPVVDVTWPESVEYCRWLTAKTGGEDAQCYVGPRGTAPRDLVFHPEKPGYRLPTEAEWEYACRAGTATAYSFGGDRELLKYYARYEGDHRPGTGPLVGGTLRPNPRGLFDVHGNVWEWCQDRYQLRLADNAADPQGPAEGSKRVLRGGGWDRGSWHCRSAYRHNPTPDYGASYMGFRLVRTLPDRPAAGK